MNNAKLKIIWLTLDKTAAVKISTVCTICTSEEPRVQYLESTQYTCDYCRNSIISWLGHTRISVANYRGFNKFLHKWVLKSNMRVYLPKARRVFDPLGVRGHAPPENFEVLDSCRCIFRSFLLLCCFIFLLLSQLI